jgi:hypothetical protein
VLLVSCSRCGLVVGLGEAMTIGDTVKVFPHGHEDQSALARVVYVSPGQLVAWVCFEERPPFCRGVDAVDRRSSHVSMLLNRYCIGPWIEYNGGGHYEIEEQAQP